MRLARARAASGSSHRLRVARIAAAIAGRVLLVLVALFVSATVGAQVYRVAVRNVALHEQIAQVESDNQKLAAENEKLALRVVHLQDPEFLVPLIHEQLGLTKPNEVFIEVAPSTPAPADQ
ncbi:MAG TPA: septum formation initiator family protein [Candidatus Acidoferrales bacterium]|nr:septum formation initiator family protein [Candidatus Acidoferrales bacterium]